MSHVARQSAEDSSSHSPLSPRLPKTGETLLWSRLYGDSLPLALAHAVNQHEGLAVIITSDSQEAEQLSAQLRFFSEDTNIDIRCFPDWETLPYDGFSPHQDIISQRLETLYHLPSLNRGVLLVPIATLLQRLPTTDFLDQSSLMLAVGDTLGLDSMRIRLDKAGYHCVAQVMEHGEFSIRGSMLDLFPMGSSLPFRIDLFDSEIETIRTFDPENQRSIEKVQNIRLLPAREFPVDEAAITRFRQAWRDRFEGDPQRCPIYSSVSDNIIPAGIEYYAPLFVESTATLFDYLPANSFLVENEDTAVAIEKFREQITERFEQLRHDIERPLLPKELIYLGEDELTALLQPYARLQLQRTEVIEANQKALSFSTRALPVVQIQARTERVAGLLQDFVESFPGRILFCAESAGRREILQSQLREFGIAARVTDQWTEFLSSDEKLALTVAPLEKGAWLDVSPPIAIITESQLFGERAPQKRRRKRKRDADAVIRNLNDLHIGAPVVHEDHGVGRYLGLQKLNLGETDAEFLALQYAGDDKLYVPVSSLHLISRYTGASPESAPLHRLGSDQWQKARKKAAERVHDVAAELLDTYARRAARKGHAFIVDNEEYDSFASAFPFEETPDQAEAIQAVVADMKSERPTDRVVCGDVGFGKTEVAMRAAFVAAQSGRQVVILVPTTLLAQQHYQNFCDRFADWPIKIEVLSRFRSKKQQDEVIAEYANGKIDILIGTHKVLQKDVRAKNLGLVIIDEEHRFGVRQKEILKSLRSEVDFLTLTATPIPRTLNMSLSGLRDLSIIATPPAHRLAIKTFVTEWNKATVREACLREIKRGGQIYFLHNQVETIEKMARELEELIPEASVAIGHGQMREKELEQVMLDFYHRRFNLLVATTIIESGIDVPTANTIIINRADRLGLAQLHQLRGRVGRSHHRAYAYLVVPHKRAMSADAVKRIEAIESLEDLGAGFTLATHDLEIRGAGELLGDDQSGQIHEIGFTMYSELLERAVKALKEGKEVDLEKPLHHGPEIDLHLPALIPDDYLPDVHNRLILYKRISSADSRSELRELQVEMIDRFGLLPEPVKNLINVTEIKLKATPLGILKIDAGEQTGRFVFGENANVDPVTILQLIQNQSQHYSLDGADKLRFRFDMKANEDRFKAVFDLLGHLSQQQA